MAVYTVYYSYLIRSYRNNSGCYLDFTAEKEALFGNLNDAKKFVSVNYGSRKNELQTVYITYRRDDSSPEKTIYYQKL